MILFFRFRHRRLDPRGREPSKHLQAQEEGRILIPTHSTVHPGNFSQRPGKLRAVTCLFKHVNTVPGTCSCLSSCALSRPLTQCSMARVAGHRVSASQARPQHRRGTRRRGLDRAHGTYGNPLHATGSTGAVQSTPGRRQLAQLSV